jgi:hypothetical protein
MSAPTREPCIDRRLRTSLGEQSETMARWLFSVLITGAFGLTSFLLAAVQVIPLAPWFWLAVTLAVLLAAQFVAYHRARVMRDEDRARREGERMELHGGLAPALDELIREGIVLLEELSKPLEERYPDHRYPLFPEAETLRRIDELQGRAREQLEMARPSLLPAFAEAANAAMRKERERLEGDAADDHATNLDKLKHFAHATHARPRILVEGVLNGLAETRERLQAS